LGGLVRSEAKKLANKVNGRKGGVVKSRKKTIPPGATPAGHDPDAAGKDERGGSLDPRPLRTTRDRSRLSGNQVCPSQTSAHAVMLCRQRDLRHATLRWCGIFIR
jgi:hypothetical protein